MKPLKIGQIGICHEHASGKMNSLKLRPELFDIVGVVDDRDTQAAHIAITDLEPYAGLPWLSEEELFRTPGLEAVAVEVPNLDLVAAAERCLAQGLPIHLDKPGGENLADFERLRWGYEEQGLAFQMGYMFRGNPAMNWILDATRKGWLGEIFEVQGCMSHDYGGEEYQPYIGSFRGGIMFNLGCHLIDFVVSLLGMPTGVTPILKTAPGDESYIKNNCLTILEYPTATATLRACSREVGATKRRRLKVCGTGGTVEIFPMERFDGEVLRMELILRDDACDFAAGAHTLEFGPVRDRYEDELVDFYRMIRGEISNPYSAEHDCQVQEVLLAAAGYTHWTR
ncbi:Gfo/Idh/MocA family oxidoreductase [Ruficoccus sp. ZRK36]|uniref:Gfo/Idh/MocA family protein n=1 Tax=Ruficoccus sp. ZRK36 TaxID=2866311 RepID=UPI001C7390CB|nr:Gfo/Idh/MocA family oxidoreductase [Ruficoccus sp. ZRK36]QYY35650.1 Gfo/Idh/MocA family oxidoreductase [Ruficoccus sp. ZRK36]